MNNQQAIRHITNLTELATDKHADFTEAVCHATGTLLKGNADLYVRMCRSNLGRAAGDARENAKLLLQLADIIDQLTKEIH